MIQTLWIPGRLPGLNEIVEDAKGSGGRGRKYSKSKREETDRIAWLAKAARLKPMGRVRVIFEWREPNLKRDVDNIRAGAKYVLDGLVAAKVLAKDGRKHVVGLADEYGLDRLLPGVLVTLIEEDTF